LAGLLLGRGRESPGAVFACQAPRTHHRAWLAPWRRENGGDIYQRAELLNGDYRLF